VKLAVLIITAIRIFFALVKHVKLLEMFVLGRIAWHFASDDPYFNGTWKRLLQYGVPHEV